MGIVEFLSRRDGTLKGRPLTTKRLLKRSQLFSIIQTTRKIKNREWKVRRRPYQTKSHMASKIQSAEPDEDIDGVDDQRTATMEDQTLPLEILGYEECPDVCSFHYYKLCSNSNRYTVGSAMSKTSDYDNYNVKPYGSEMHSRLRKRKTDRSSSNSPHLNENWGSDKESDQPTESPVYPHHPLQSSPVWVEKCYDNSCESGFLPSEENSGSLSDNGESCPNSKSSIYSEDSCEYERVTLELSSGAPEDVEKTLQNLATCLGIDSSQKIKVRYSMPVVKANILSNTDTETSLESENDESQELSSSESYAEDGRAIIPNLDKLLLPDYQSTMTSVIEICPQSEIEYSDSCKFEEGKAPEPDLCLEERQTSNCCQCCGVAISNDTIVHLQKAFEDMQLPQNMDDPQTIYFCSDNCFTQFSENCENSIIASWKTNEAPDIRPHILENENVTSDKGFNNI